MQSIAITLTIACLTLIMQKTIVNILIGVMYRVTKPFKEGDKITIIRNNGNELASGYVMKRGLMQTKLKSYNQDVYIIANSLLEDSCIVNSDYAMGVNHTEYIRISIDSHLHKAKDIIKELLLNFPGTTNTEENTTILFKYEPGCMRIQYNIRTENVDSSYRVCSDFVGCLIKMLDMEDDITLM